MATHFLNLPILHSRYTLFSSSFSAHSLGFYLLTFFLCLITPESMYTASLELPHDLLALLSSLSYQLLSLSSPAEVSLPFSPGNTTQKSLCRQNEMGRAKATYSQTMRLLHPTQLPGFPDCGKSGTGRGLTHQPEKTPSRTVVIPLPETSPMEEQKEQKKV